MLSKFVLIIAKKRCIQSLGLTVSNNDIFRLLILGCDNTEEMYEGDMIIYYTNTETGLSHQANTEIRSYLN